MSTDSIRRATATPHFITYMFLALLQATLPSCLLHWGGHGHLTDDQPAIIPNRSRTSQWQGSSQQRSCFCHVESVDHAKDGQIDPQVAATRGVLQDFSVCLVCVIWISDSDLQQIGSTNGTETPRPVFMICTSEIQRRRSPKYTATTNTPFFFLDLRGRMNQGTKAPELFN